MPLLPVLVPGAQVETEPGVFKTVFNAVSDPLGPGTFQNATLNESGNFAVVADFTDGSRAVLVASFGALLRAWVDCPVMYLQPQDAEILPGSTHTLSANAGADGSLAYQWRRDGVAIANGPLPAGGSYAGVNTPMLTLAHVGAAHTGEYNCVISNSCGEAVSRTALVVLADGCDPIDFNRDGVFPDTSDLADFLAVFSGGVCDGQAPQSPPCNADIDFNNDGVFPDTSDIDAFLRLFGGGAC